MDKWTRSPSLWCPRPPLSTPPKKETGQTIMIQCQNAKCCIAAFRCAFCPHPAGGSCDPFHCHTALGALTASGGPSETPNVNLMTWCWANDKYARWRWQPFFLRPIYMIFFPLTTASSLPRSCFLKTTVMLHLLQHCASLALNNALCIMQRKRPPPFVLNDICFKTIS